MTRLLVLAAVCLASVACPAPSRAADVHGPGDNPYGSWDPSAFGNGRPAGNAAPILLSDAPSPTRAPRVTTPPVPGPVAGPPQHVPPPAGATERAIPGPARMPADAPTIPGSAAAPVDAGFDGPVTPPSPSPRPADR